MFDKLPPYLRVNYDSMNVDDHSVASHRRSLSNGSNKSETSDQKDTISFVPTSPIYVVPSQYLDPAIGSNDSVLNQVLENHQKLTPPSIRYPDVFPVRKMMYLDSVRELQDDYDPIYNSMDHTMFIYPTSFDKFQHR
jgi:hypothetical protein